jgi:hypothetical protein
VLGVVIFLWPGWTDLEQIKSRDKAMQGEVVEFLYFYPGKLCQKLVVFRGAEQDFHDVTQDATCSNIAAPG